LILHNINEDLVRGKRVLDIGCGSGILSIAAEKMGATEVLGVDIDEDSINNARENAILNQLSKCSFTNLPIDQIKKKKFEVVFANIIAAVLIKLPQEISRLVVPGGVIFLSGLLEENLDEIEKTYCEWGLKVISKEPRGEWFFMELKKEIE
jgi:ribosomal protein L11 methyltransferase